MEYACASTLRVDGHASVLMSRVFTLGWVHDLCTWAVLGTGTREGEEKGPTREAEDGGGAKEGRRGEKEGGGSAGKISQMAAT